MKKGKFVVIDGLDGSGKKTQVDLLVEYCQKHKIKTAVVDFPQYYKTFFGQLTGRYLKGEFGSLKQTNPYLASLTYAGDRWQAKPAMEKALKEGKLLLANRYTSSSQAFMAGKFVNIKDQDKCLNWIARLEQDIYQCPKEDLIIYLSVPASLGQQLVLKKGKKKYMGSKNIYDLHEENLKYLKRVEIIYLRLIKKNSHWIKIDCLNSKGNLKSKEKIHALILKVLKKRQCLQ